MLKDSNNARKVRYGNFCNYLINKKPIIARSWLAVSLTSLLPSESLNYSTSCKASSRRSPHLFFFPYPLLFPTLFFSSTAPYLIVPPKESKSRLNSRVACPILPCATTIITITIVNPEGRKLQYTSKNAPDKPASPPPHLQN